MTQGTILITGAGGFTGGHACKRFAASGWEVVAVTSSGGSGGADDAAGASFVKRCDLTDGEAVARLMRAISPDAVLHLAGRNAVDRSWREPASTLAANLMSTAHLLEGARGLVDCRVLVVGSMLRTGSDDPASEPHPYGFSKALQVAAARAWHRWYGSRVMIAEPSNLVGPGPSGGLCGKLVRWTVAAEEAEGDLRPFVLSSLGEARDFMDVRDAVAAYEAVLLSGEPGRSYAVESGAFRTLADVKRVFDEEAAVALPWEIGDNARIDRPAPRDTTAIRTLGWGPEIDFRRSIRDALEDERDRRSREKRAGGEGA